MKNINFSQLIENIVNKTGTMKNKLPDVYTVKATVRILKEYYLDSNFVLGNAVAPPDYPIVYCSDGFCELTGYTCILFKVILYQK